MNYLSKASHKSEFVCALGKHLQERQKVYKSVGFGTSCTVQPICAENKIALDKNGFDNRLSQL